MKRPASTTALAASASPLLPIVSRSILLPSSCASRAVKRCPSASKLALTCQYSCGAENLDLALAVDDQPQRDRLHPARRLRARQLAPQDRRQSEADQIIERAPRPVSVDQILIEPARMLHRLGHRRIGDRVEGHALDVGRQRLLLPKHLLDVPADRLALAVGVGGEDQRIGVLRLVGDGAHLLRAVGRDLPQHLETHARDRPSRPWAEDRARAQTTRARDAWPQIFLDGFRLGRRFDDDELQRISSRIRVKVGWAIRARQAGLEN